MLPWIWYFPAFSSIISFEIPWACKNFACFSATCSPRSGWKEAALIKIKHRDTKKTYGEKKVYTIFFDLLVLISAAIIVCIYSQDLGLFVLEDKL